LCQSPRGTIAYSSMHIKLKRLLLVFVFLLFSLITGVTGYMSIEGFDLLQAFYMAVITLSTVGFAEVAPLSQSGRLFTAVYIMLNLGIIAYATSVIATYLFEGELRSVLRSFFVGREVKRMNNHIIICGFGRNGEKVSEMLAQHGRKFVIIDLNAAVFEEYASRKEYQFLVGDATQDEVLLKANIEKATHVITALPKDTDNLFIALSARELNSNLKIIARANDENAAKKLRLAVKENIQIVMPENLGGMHMANLVLKPYVIQFLNQLNGVGKDRLVLEEFSVKQFKEEYIDCSIKQVDVRNTTGATILAFKDEVKGFQFSPEPDALLDAKDVLIVLGTEEQIKNFRERICR